MFLHLLHFIHFNPLLLLLLVATGRCCSTANLCSDQRFCLRLCQRKWNTDFSGRNRVFFQPGDFFFLPSVNLGKNSNPATPRVFFFLISFFLYFAIHVYCAIFPQTGQFSLRTGHALPLACKSLSLDCLKHLPSRFTGSSVFTSSQPSLLSEGLPPDEQTMSINCPRFCFYLTAATSCLPLRMWFSC